MADRYLDKSIGSNANSGASPALPWLTLAYAWSQLTAGDILYVKGVYAESLGGGTTLPSGTIGNPITFRPYVGQATWGMTPGSGNPAVPLIDPAHGETYITFEDTVFDGMVLGSAFVQFLIGGNNTPTHWTFNRCEFKNSTKSGVLPHGNFWGFNQCLAHNCGLTDQDHGLYLSGTDNTIDGGSYYSCGGLGIQIFDSGSSSISRNTIKNSICRNNGTGGFIITSGSDNTAYNNLVYGNGTTGCSISESGTSTNNSLYNNTVYGNSGYGILIGAGSTSGVVKNNISYLNTAGNLNDLGTGTTKASNLTASDPLFVDAAGGNFHLTVSSPAIGAGVDLSLIFTTDKSGATRIVPWDEGAFIFTGSGAGRLLAGQRNMLMVY